MNTFGTQLNIYSRNMVRDCHESQEMSFRYLWIYQGTDNSNQAITITILLLNSLGNLLRNP